MDRQGEQVPQAMDQLRPFILQGVTKMNQVLGTGAYGVVEELQMGGGLVCAGKKIHETLINQGNEGAQNMVDKYYEECIRLSQLHHPNIVQFLGICFLPGSRLPVLVMERLQSSLHKLLETTRDIPLHTKLAILKDVATGLVFLHNRHPVVVHRDLTALNVLLNSDMTAKIADLGNARMLTHDGTMSYLPGTLVYMPPEAFTQNYGTPLDMFSFGHLALFAAIQVFPKTLLVPTGRTELKRREEYIKTLNRQLGPKHAALVTLVKDCLKCTPDKRPTAIEARTRLERLQDIQQHPYQQMNRVQLEKSIHDMTEIAEAKDREITGNRALIQQLQRKLQEKELENRGLEEVCRGEDMAAESLRQQLKDSESMLSSKEAYIEALAMEVRGKDKMSQAKPEMKLSTVLKCSLPLEWKENDIKMPAEVFDAQSVVLGGKVYIGGGVVGSGDAKVLEYTIEGGGWQEIETPTSFYSIAVASDKLILAGGKDSQDSPTNQVWEYDSNAAADTLPWKALPAMPTARLFTSAMATSNGYLWWGDKTARVWKYWTLASRSGTLQHLYPPLQGSPHSVCLTTPCT